MTSQHVHHTPGRALRLILARLHAGAAPDVFANLDSELTLVRELDDCGLCSYLVADELADMIVREVKMYVREHPDVGLEDFARYYQRMLADQLDRDDDDSAA